MEISETHFLFYFNYRNLSKAIEQLLSQVTQLDVVVNNAGVACFGPAEEHSVQDVKDIFETNLFGVHRVLKATLPQMRKQRSGRIINITSLAGIVGTPNMGLYSATKHALEGYTKSMAYELESFGIDMCLVKPGEYQTEVTNNATTASDSIKDYDNFKKSVAQAFDPNKTQPGPEPVVDLIVEIIEASKPRMHNRIGEFANAIPILSLFPSLLKKVTKKAYGIK